MKDRDNSMMKVMAVIGILALIMALICWFLGNLPQPATHKPGDINYHTYALMFLGFAVLEGLFLALNAYRSKKAKDIRKAHYDDTKA